MDSALSPRLLILGTADWNQPIATNQHYVVRELARAVPVIYVESMGLRTPRLNKQDLRRIARRLGLARASDGVMTVRAVPKGVEVRSPKVLPRHTGLARALNQPRVDKLVKDWADQGERLLWTYTPVTYGMASHADAVVYHCVDLYGQVDGIDADLIDASERDLAKHATVAIGTSPAVVEHLIAQGFKRVEYWPNVADTDVIAAARPTDVHAHDGRAVFAGALTSMKIDFDLLSQVVEAGFDLHLAGPIGEGDSQARSHVAALVAAGATHHGLLSPQQVAELYWTCDIGLIPYKINGLTRGVSPLKTYEYLAAGLGVVATPLPSMSARGGDIVIEPAGPQFIHAARSTCGATPEIRASRTEYASEHSWTTRGDEARRLLKELVAIG